MAKPPKLPADIAALLAAYGETFGFVPPIPNDRIRLGAELDPEFTRLAEKLRARALYSDVLDDKTAQLIAFALLLATANPASYMHALAARRYGASWAELHQAAEIVCVLTSGMNGLNPAGQVVARLRREEAEGKVAKRKRRHLGGAARRRS